MFKLSQPKPIFLPASQCAVLWLHAYTSTVRDMKALAESLHQYSYTYYTASYSGHGLAIDDFLNYTSTDWLQDSHKTYQFLRQQGYEQIAVMGVSLGAILSLELSKKFPVSACISMSAPLEWKVNDLFKRLEQYNNYLNQFQNNKTTLNSVDWAKKSMNRLQTLQQLIQTTIEDTASVIAPIFLLYGELDDELYQSSAQTIYDHVNFTKKRLRIIPIQDISWHLEVIKHSYLAIF